MTTIGIFGCSSITNAGKVLISIIPQCNIEPKKYIPAAGEAAVNYFEEQVTPIVDEITTELQNIAFFQLFLIILLVVIPLLIFMVWTAFTLGLPNRYLLFGLVFVLILMGILAFAVYRYLRNTVTQELSNTVRDLSNLFDDDATAQQIISTINAASGVYISTITSIPPP